MFHINQKESIAPPGIESEHKRLNLLVFLESIAPPGIERQQLDKGLDSDGESIAPPGIERRFNQFRVRRANGINRTSGY